MSIDFTLFTIPLLMPKSIPKLKCFLCLGMLGARFSLQKLQDLASFLKGSAQIGHIKKKFLQVLQNSAALSIGWSQYGHIKAVILIGGNFSKRPW
jgi:hypothetical protein